MNVLVATSGKLREFAARTEPGRLERNHWLQTTGFRITYNIHNTYIARLSFDKFFLWLCIDINAIFIQVCR